MKTTGTLPEGYSEYFSVDLQKDKKKALFVNLLAVAITVIMIVPVHFLVPLTTLFSMESGMGLYAARFGALLALMAVYVILHESVHGVAMKLCGTKKVKYGFTGNYAYAASDDYYGKRGYIFIALAPVVLWGIVLGVVCALVPEDWFWVVYFIQIFNFSGAAGDYYVTVKFSRFPKDILIKDYGVGMTVYSKE